MRVTIIDLDWYNKRSFLPNPKCMKISSYYKQKNAIINFVTNEYEIKYDYDLMYIVREDPMGSFPESINIRADNVYLIGNGMRFYDRYLPDITGVMAACRPDYTLYKIREENKLAKAQMVQFFYDGKLMPLIQDYHIAYEKTKFTFVLDDHFWEHSAKDIEKCVKKMKFDKNVVFKFPINLDSILLEKKKLEMFLSLHLDLNQNEIFITLNTDEQINNLLTFLKKFDAKKRQKLRLVSNICYSGSHFGGGRTALKDFYKYISLIYQMKKLKTKIILKAPPRMESPFWFHFEDLEAWTTYRIYDSYIEFMTACNREQYNFKYSLEEFLSNSLLWSDDAIQRMAEMWRNYPEIMEQFGYLQWGDQKLEGIDMRYYVRGLRIRRE